MIYLDWKQCASVLGLGACTVLLLKKISENKREYFQKVGNVKSITIFPLKGARAVSCQSAQLTNQGLIGSEKQNSDSIQDRSFIIICNKTNKWVSSKQNPKIAMISIKIISGSSILLSAEGYGSVVAFPAEPFVERSVTIFKMTANLFECGVEANYWITNFLNKTDKSGNIISYSLAYFDTEKSVRPGKQEIERRLQGNGEQNTDDLDFNFNLADMSSIMITTKQSLNDLNYKLESNGHSKVTQEHFRGNIDVACDDNSPFQEDNWNECYIGNNFNWKMKYFHKCKRCLSTTVSPETGKRNAEKQPLTMLNSYRMPPEKKGVYNSAVYGTYMAGFLSNPKSCEIRVGDPVYVTLKKNKTDLRETLSLSSWTMLFKKYWG